MNHIGDAFGGPVVQAVTDFLVALTGPIGLIYEAYNLLKGEPAPKQESQEDKAQRMASTFIANINSSKDKAGAYAKNIAQLQKVLDHYMANGDKEKEELTRRVIEIVEEHMDKTFSGYGKIGKKFKAVVKTTKGNDKETFIPDSIGYYEKQIADLRKVEKNVTTNEEWEALQSKIDKLTTKVKELKGELDVDALINLEYQDVEPAEAESEGQSYGEQLMQGILTGMANKMQDADTNMLKNLLQVVVTNGLDVDIPANDLMERILGDGEDIPDSYWDNLAKAINEKLAELNLDPIELNFGTGEVNNKKEDEHKSEDPMKTFQKGVNGVTSILSGIQQMGMKLPDGIQQTVSVIQGLMSVIEGVHTIISLFSTTSMAANTAALVANTAALTVNSTVSAIPIFANGGIVPHAANGYFIPGNSFSGDTTPIMANAGELVLNESQQGVLASRLSDVGGMRNIHVTGHLEGENIALSVDRWGRRTGKGELAFWKNQ